VAGGGKWHGAILGQFFGGSGLSGRKFEDEDEDEDEEDI
jgi:hypothetical protein